MLFNIIEKKVREARLIFEILPFLSSVKRLVFDLTKIPSLKRLIGISPLIAEALIAEAFYRIEFG